jgi:hypothetical protein
MARLILALGFVVSLGGAALAEPPTVERPHEILSDRPSGFWTSNRPAVGGAYKWRLLELGCAITLLTGWLTYRLVKNARGPRRVTVVSSSDHRTTP